jgi:hypothetical protein
MNRALLQLLLVALVIVATFSAIGCEVSGRGSIRVEMLDDNGTPVAGGWVRIYRDVGPAAIMKTDQDGRYYISDIKAGQWQVEFYTEYGLGLGLESVTVRANETIKLVFTIGEKPRPPNMDRIVPPY